MHWGKRLRGDFNNAAQGGEPEVLMGKKMGAELEEKITQARKALDEAQTARYTPGGDYNKSQEADYATRTIRYLEDELRGGRVYRDFLDEARARPATAKDYADWVEKALGTGVDINFAPFAMPNSHVVAQRNAALPVLTGVQSLEVLVPKGIEIKPTGNAGNRHKVFLGLGIPDGELSVVVDNAQTGKMSFYTGTPSTINYGHSSLYLSNGTKVGNEGVRKPERITLYADTVAELKQRGLTFEKLCKRCKLDGNSMPQLKEAFAKGDGVRGPSAPRR